MENFAWWETIIIGSLVLLVTLWLQTSAKAAFKRSENIPADWMAVLLPMIFVILFIILLIAMV